MEMPVENVGDVAVVTLQGEYLDASIADEFKRDMQPTLEATTKAVFDMSQLRFVDSAGIGAILSCLRRLNAKDGDLKLCGLSKALRASFEIARMHRIIDILETKEEAVAAFAQTGTSSGS